MSDTQTPQTRPDNIERIESVLGVLMTFGVTQTAMRRMPGTRAVLWQLGWTRTETQELERRLDRIVSGPQHPNS